MSSDEDSDDRYGMNSSSSKRRKVAGRACDRCRRKKVRCDAFDQAGSRCSHCVAARLTCTFLESAKKRAAPKGYIEDLEKRCDALEKLIARVAPHINITEEVGPSFTQDTWSVIKAANPNIVPNSTLGERSSRSPASILPPSPILTSTHHPKRPMTEPPPPLLCLADPESSDDDVVQDFVEGDSNNFVMKPLEKRLAQMSLQGRQSRFYGKSAGVFLVQGAMSLKEEVNGQPGPRQFPTYPLRVRYWDPNPWEFMYPDLPNPAKFNYPPPDLAEELVNLAFRNVLHILPMIHRPSFDSFRKSHLHFKNVCFARLYLMVCAVGSRYSDDERAYLKGDDGEVYWSSAGWDYFSQVLNMRWPILAPAGQSDLQVMGLMSIYLQSTSSATPSWLVVGIALRAAQDIGLHRERIYPADKPFESQMWKRIFWSLVSIDCMTSTAFGRPVAIFDEDIDAALPLEVDDEYWDEEKKQWRQPEEKPSLMTAVNHQTKLMKILTRALRSIYSINKHKVHHGYVGENWESSTVANLDSELNSWLNSLPDHLKWNPKIKDDAFFRQAAQLRIMYHWVQITIHRPFITAITIDGKASSLSFPSLAICTNAARAASHVIGEYVKRGLEGGPMAHLIAFTIGVILLISIWAVKKSGLNVDFAKQADDIQSCIDFLHRGERTWHAAGKFYDVLTQLASIHDIPISVDSSPSDSSPSKKRSREDDSDRTSNSHDSSVSSAPSSLSTWGAFTNLTPPQVPPIVDSSSTFTFRSLFGSPSSTMPLNIPSASLTAPTTRDAARPLSTPQVPWGAPPPMRAAAYPAESVGDPIGNTNTATNMFDPVLNLHSSAAPSGLFQEFLGVFSDANVLQTGGANLTGLFGFQGGTDDWSWLDDMLGGAPQGPRGPDNAPPNL